jgi:enoyl-CoA hydratase/carnithine racemase
MSYYQEIAYEVERAVATITLDRPESLNAFTERMAEELITAVDQADADDAVRVIVVTGRGRAFCVGRDLAGGGATFDRSRSGVGPEDFRDLGGTVSLRLFACLKPVIAAINGPALGAGMTMTLPMDIRLAADSARFGLPFVRRGIVPEGCSSWFLPRIVGLGRALDWIETGRVFPSREALEAGLVRSLHPAERLLDEAYRIAAEISASTSAVSVALARQMVLRMHGMPGPIDAHKLESELMFAVGQSADAREGVESFLEKRPARFSLTVSKDLPKAFSGYRKAPRRRHP